MAFSEIATSVTIINSGLIGYYGISLTNPSTSAESAIAAGSSIEMAGGFFKAGTETAINTSSWTAITTATTAYIALTPSGTAGSQIITASYVSDAPVYSESKQGFYSSAGSNIRVIGSIYKVGPTSYGPPKYLFSGNQDYRMRGVVELLTATSGTFIVPADVYRLKVIVVPGGGGGAEGHLDGNAGSSGGNSTFGTITVNGAGGGTAGGTYLGGSAPSSIGGVTGKGGQVYAGGSGGGSFGGAGGRAGIIGDGGLSATYGGGGGGGSGTGSTSIGGAGGGGFFISDLSAQILSVVPGQSIAYTCGTGGAGGTGGGSGGGGGTGGAGVIIVEY